MTFNKKIAAIGAAGLLLAGMVAAQVHQHATGDRMERHLHFVANYLSLTDAQKETAKAILQDAKTQAQPIVDQLKQGHQNVAAAIKAGKSDAELTQLASQQGALMGQLAAIHARSLAKFYAQLTPDQKTKADQLHDHFQNMIQSRFGGQFRHHHQQGQAPAADKS